MTRIPLVVSKRQTIGELVELGAYRAFTRIEFDVRRNCFFGIVEDPADTPIPVEDMGSFTGIALAMEGLGRVLSRE